MADAIRPKPHWYQRAIRWSMFALFGALSLGGALDAIGNASSLISPAVASILTAVAGVGLVAANAYFRRHPLFWVWQDGTPGSIVRLGTKPILGVAGAVVLLWVGAAMHTDARPDGPLLHMAVGGHVLSDGEKHEVAYAIPTDVKDGAFRTTYIPLYISNAGTKTAENVKIILRYPESDAPIALTRRMRQDIIGIKEPQQVKRRSENFEGMSLTYFSIDDVDRLQSFLLNEPIDLPPNLAGSPIRVAKIFAELSAKDAEPQFFEIRIRAVAANTLEEADSIEHVMIWSEAVSERRSTPFWAYLAKAISSRRATGSLIVPKFSPANSTTEGSGYQSDPLHDQSSSFMYTPEPLRYAFAGLWGR